MQRIPLHLSRCVRRAGLSRGGQFYLPLLSLSARCYGGTSSLHAPKMETPAYQCGQCGKSFRLLNALNHHIMTKHAGHAKAMVLRAGKLEEVKPDEVKSKSSQTRDVTPAASMASTGAVWPTTQLPTGFPGMEYSPLGGAAPFATPLGVASAVPLKSPPGPGATIPTGANGNETESFVTDEDAEKKLFVCTICQKTFRLEAALQHHYQAKHNMEMPTTSTSTASTRAASHSTTIAGAATTIFGGNTDDAARSMTGTHYVHSQESVLPQAPQYHLDVAPNAPEEGDVAAHWRCVNHCVVLGPVQNIQEGYVFEEKVVQFTLITDFEGPSPGDPDKDFHTVRVFDSSFCEQLKKELKEGERFLVTGRLRMIPQYDSAMKKYYHYPVIQVHPGCGSVVRV
ncbi:putative RNA-editing complex protein [Trypanosoma rangeli]|uniref:Putative RNA-editing complex protein n=1 Tax=Trypanosoma rangeli TaxID=5698 RepID=A0A422N9Y4_TRYRA|nr:putative RNA-editing complex protein [Trypanosoma rangeli]RNF02298.1 putative RNA-editing complex protein [Trypanosoma rangeli]|eukprot:RNF02298.1 putative RNA-editing complex protein [Trypanosoma rangeli]